jgi:hypothetical protein
MLDKPVAAAHDALLAMDQRLPFSFMPGRHSPGTP